MADNLSTFCCHIVTSDGIGLGKPKVKVIDISITLNRETKGDIRVLYKGATNVKSVRK